jgi:hypothetical protein
MDAQFIQKIKSNLLATIGYQIRRATDHQIYIAAARTAEWMAAQEVTQEEWNILEAARVARAEDQAIADEERVQKAAIEAAMKYLPQERASWADKIAKERAYLANRGRR